MARKPPQDPPFIPAWCLGIAIGIIGAPLAIIAALVSYLS